MRKEVSGMHKAIIIAAVGAALAAVAAALVYHGSQA